MESRRSITNFYTHKLLESPTTKTLMTKQTKPKTTGRGRKKAPTVVQHDSNIEFSKSTKRKESWEERGEKKKKKLTRSQYAHIPVKGRKNSGETASSISLAIFFVRQRSR